MIDYTPLYTILEEAKATSWLDKLHEQTDLSIAHAAHGDLDKWQAVIDQLATPQPSSIVLDNAAIKIGNADDINDADRLFLQQQLQQFLPWRKGPYDLFGIQIDTEWRSDWKWDRLKDHISPLQHRLVLDVGCGNGYHCWRMLGAGAKMVVGIDPLALNVSQFLCIRKLHGEAPIYVLPIGLENVPPTLKLFDTVFSMGVLYHRRSPIDHLMELKGCLQSGGELVLETLVIDGGLGEVLVPEGRYAKMRNVWFLPSCDTLISWLKRCGFNNIRLVDVNDTSIEEQRSTEWMQFHSLKDFLDPSDHSLTCEGLPAPKRAIFIADCP